MKNFRFFLKTAAMIVACFTVCLMLTGCDEEDPKQFTVTFISNGGNAVSPQMVKVGEKITKPDAPTREIYAFVAWYKEAVLTNEWNFDDDVVTEDVTLYAKWERKNFNATFYSNGGSDVESQVVVNGEKIVKPQDPTRSGFTFDAWYKESALTNVWNFETDVVTSHVTLHAKWTEGSSTETTAEFDNSNFGLYKGIIVGSSGTIWIEINNGNNEVKGLIKIGNKTDQLLCTETIVNGQKIVNVTFQGSFSTFKFSVDADGKNPIIVDIEVEGHNNVSASIFKETSKNVVYGYEGTVSESAVGMNDGGVFNVLRNNNLYIALSKTSENLIPGGLIFEIRGEIETNGDFTGGPYRNETYGITLNISGKVSGNNVNGTWQTAWDEDGYFSGLSSSGTFTGNKSF